MGNLEDGSDCKGRILLVEDEAGIREVAREVLETEGFHITEAVDGAEGLAMFLENPSGVDLVILDLVMPRMHGFQVLDGIREACPGMRVLLSSGYSPEQRPEVLVQTPILGFLPKPYRCSELVDAVNRLLRSAKGEAPG